MDSKQSGKLGGERAATITEPEPVTAAPAPGVTEVTPPSAAIKVTCPKCGVGGELASEALLGTATCGNPKHADTLLVRA